MSKTVYLFDPKTFEFMGTWEAQESPLEPDKFIEPIDSTEVVPPATGKNETPVFSNGAWSLVPDFRGQTFYDQTTGAPVVIEALGAVASNLASTPPPPTPAQLHAEFQASAMVALGKSDLTLIRCLESGVPIPPAWASYRKALRDIVNGADTVSTTLPVAPPYPAGT